MGRADAVEERRQVRVYLRGPAELDTISRLSLDVVCVHFSDPEGGEGEGPSVDIVAGAAELRLLDRLGFRVRQRERTGSPGPRSSPAASTASLPPGFGQGQMGGYYTLAEIEGLLDQYAMTFPHVVSPRLAIGTTHQGRTIWAVKVSDQPNQSEAEPRVLIDALHHAREPVSAQCALLLLHRLVTSYGVDPELTELVDGREIWFVPVVNPDGYVHNEVLAPSGGGLWRKNRRPVGSSCFGVDLNRNYPYQWGVDDLGSSADPCSDAYRGPAAGSESEVAAIDQLAAAQGFSLYVSLHAHGGLMLYPFGYSTAAHPARAQYEMHGAELHAQNGYQYGPVSDLLALANGNAIDHLSHVRGAEAWAFEVGSSFWPPVGEMLAVAEENVPPLLYLIRIAGSDVIVRGLDVVDGANGYADPGETVELRFTLENRGLFGTADAIAIGIATADPDVTVLAPTGVAAALPALSSGVTTGGPWLRIEPTAAPGDRVPFTLTLTFDGRTAASTCFVDVGTPRRIAVDEFETERGWQAGVPGDDAFTGKWTRADPIGIQQGLNEAQPENDTTPAPGKRCFVTGNDGTAAGQDDVDDGKTTLLSPRFDLSAAVEPRVRYERFYWCSKVDDPFVIEVSNDDGQNWSVVETVIGRPNVWTPIEQRLGEILPITSQMRFRFVAADPVNTSVTEALVDDFELIDFGKEPHLTVLGRTALDDTFELQLASEGGTRFLLLVSLNTGMATVPGLSGVFLLDPSAFLIVADVPAAASGFTRIPVHVKNQPNLVGVQAWFQALSLGTTPAFSNAAQVKVESP